MKLRLSQDVWVLLVLLAFVVGVGVVVGTSGYGSAGTELVPRRTSYSSAPGGLKALYTTLGKLGYQTGRHRHALSRGPEPGTLFLIGPRVPLSHEEWQSLQRWVESGNLLIVASWDLGDDKHLASSRPCQPSFLASDVHVIRAPKSAKIDERKWIFSHAEGFAAPPT